MGLVAADGDRTRYQGGAYEVRETSGRFGVNLGGTAGWKSCPKEGTGLFYFHFLKGGRGRWHSIQNDGGPGPFASPPRGGGMIEMYE